MNERRIYLLMLFGKRNPHLQSMNRPFNTAHRVAAALRMDNAASRRHPIDIAWADFLNRANAVAMKDGALV